MNKHRRYRLKKQRKKLCTRCKNKVFRYKYCFDCRRKQAAYNQRKRDANRTNLREMSEVNNVKTT